jgi:hypothetical protein
VFCVGVKLSLSLKKKEQKLRVVFENLILRRICGPERKDVTGG